MRLALLHSIAIHTHPINYGKPRKHSSLLASVPLPLLPPVRFSAMATAIDPHCCVPCTPAMPAATGRRGG